MTSYQFILIEGSLFFGFYICLHRLFFKKINAFLWNRFALLALPFISYGIPIFMNKYQSIGKGIAILNLKPLLVTAENSTKATTVINTSIDFTQVVFYVWVIIAAFFIIRLIYNYFRINISIPKKIVEKGNGYTIYWDETGNDIWSFFKQIVLPERLSKSVLPMILLHESVHAKELHSLDNLFSGICQSLLWWNPFVYLWINDIKINHEYIADAKVIQQYNSKEYGNLLLNHSLNTNNNKIVNAFLIKSNLKKRIVMLKKNQKIGKMTVVLTACCLLISFAAIAAQQRLNGNKNTVSNKATTHKRNMLLLQDSIYNSVDTMPKFPGGTKALYDYLGAHIKYPADAQKKNIQGTVYVSFVVSATGKIVDVKILRGINDEAINKEAIRAIKAMPDWIPGKQNGKNVNVKYIIPVVFNLTKPDKKK